MGIEKQGSKGSGGYVGGFLQLFDWNGKSRKKLFSTKSDLPEGSKQGKRSCTNLPMTRLRLMIDEDDNGGSSSIKGNSDYSCASSMTDEEGNGTRAPGVVARLMGLDSLPTSNVAEPYSTPFFNTQSFRDSHGCRTDLEFRNEHEGVRSSYQPTTLEGLSRNLVESRPQKMQSRPIEKFQTEILPPKSAKFIPITHHKLLSPIKNPGFISTKNAAHIMEEAAKIIKSGPQISTRGKMPSLGSSSSVPLRVQDLKDKVESKQQPSRLHEPSRRLVESNAVKHLKGQSLNKSWNGSEDTPQFRASSDSEESNSVGLKSKGKSISLAIQAKVNLQKREGLSSSRILMDRKEPHEVKSNQPPFKSQPSTQKNIRKKSSTHNSSGVLRQNNQKQNCPMNRDKLPSKPSVPVLKSRKATSTDASLGRSKTLNKVGSRKTGLEKTDIEKESTRTRNLPRKKRSIEGDHHLEKCGFVGTILVDKKEKPIQPNVPMDGHLKRVEDNRSKGMDVVSFTFTSPMVKSMPGSQSSSQIVEKNNNFSLDSHSEKIPADTRNSKLSSVGLNVIKGDALSILLEQKLRELTHGVEPPSNQNSVKLESVATSKSILQDLASALNAESSVSTEHDKIGLHTDKSSWLYNSDCSSSREHMLKMIHKGQGVEEMDWFTSNNIKARKELDHQHPSPVSILEPSFSIESYNSSDSGDNNSFKGIMQCSSIQAEMEISDSASSTFTETVGREVKRSSMAYHTRSDNKKLQYVREILCNAELMLKDFALGRTPGIINPLLFDQLEKTWSRSDVEDKDSRLRRKVLFDCVTECLDLRCRRYVGGGCGSWAKVVTMVQRKGGWLAEEVYKEISGWGSMVDWMVDELLDKDMSTHNGRWLDFEIEEIELEVEIERSILNSLVDEVVADILSV